MCKSHLFGVKTCITSFVDYPYKLKTQIVCESHWKLVDVVSKIYDVEIIVKHGENGTLHVHHKEQ